MRGVSVKAVETVVLPRPRVPAEIIPLSIAFFAISFAFGVLAREADMALALALTMSALVYAGTSQVVALGLMAAHQPAWLIVLVTLLINARLFLMSSVMVEPTRGWKTWVRYLFAFSLTDESFALLLAPGAGGLESPRRALWIQGGAYVAWIAGTLLGFSLGADSSQLKGLGLDFALVAMMLAVLVLQIRNHVGLVVALVGGGTAVAFAHLNLTWAAPLAAAVVAPGVGIWMERRCKSKC